LPVGKLHIARKPYTELLTPASGFYVFYSINSTSSYRQQPLSQTQLPCSSSC